MSNPSKTFNRREMLGSLGFGATASLGFMMTQENATGKNPAAEVVDKGANLKITDVQMFHVGKLYVRIQTNAGITGWGETFGLNSKVAIALVEAMAGGPCCRSTCFVASTISTAGNSRMLSIASAPDDR